MDPQGHGARRRGEGHQVNHGSEQQHGSGHSGKPDHRDLLPPLSMIGNTGAAAIRSGYGTPCSVDY